MLYFIEGNLSYNQEICTICGSRKLERLILKIIESGDMCKIDIRASQGVLSRGEITTQTGTGMCIRFVKVNDFPESQKQILDFMNRNLEMQKK